MPHGPGMKRDRAVLCCERLVSKQKDQVDWLTLEAGSDGGLAHEPSTLTDEDRTMRYLFALAGSAFLLGVCGATAQTELSKYADAKGYIDVQKLTCAQLAGTYQEDADFLGVWYSGWYNGLGKKHAINVPRVKENIHNVIVYCKGHQNITVIKAIDIIFKTEKSQ
jgi:hypothetical protein